MHAPHYDRRVVTRVGYLGPPGTFTEEALLTQPDLAAGTPVAVAHGPRGDRRGRAGRRRRRRGPDRELIEGSVSVTLDTLAFDSDLLIQREIDLPVSLQPLRPARSPPRRHPHRRVVPQRRSRSAGAGSPRSCRTADARGRRTPPPTRPARCHDPRRRELAAICNALGGATSTGSRCSPPTSRTTPRTRPGSCSSAAACPRRPATTRRRSCASSARTGPVRCSASSRSSRPGRQPHQAGVPADQAGPRRLLLLHRLRGARRRRAGRRLPAQPGRQAGRGEVPRLVPGRRAEQGRRRRQAATDAWRAAAPGWRTCGPRSAPA